MRHMNGNSVSCKWCDAMFVPTNKRGKIGQFCNIHCRRSFAYYGESRAQLLQHRYGECLMCGSATTTLKSSGLPKKYCSKECSDSARAEKVRLSRAEARQPIECTECGNVFTPQRATKMFCSQQCARRSYRRTHKSHPHVMLRGCGHRGRARRYGVIYDRSVRLDRVAERDGWRCQTCGRKVRLNAKVRGRTATIGHIVALSRGGNHTWDNVQLECMSCNTKAGVKTHGQGRLF